MLNFLGIGSAFNTSLGNNSAFIKKHSSMLLIDCGSTVFNRLQTLNLFDDTSNIYVAVTHTHPDHVGSLGELIFYSHYALNHKPSLLFPDKSLITSILSNMGVDKNFYEVIDSKEIHMCDSCISFDISFFPASHVSSIPSYSLLLYEDSTRIFYSGDSNEVLSIMLEKLQNSEIDLFYQDTCGLDYEGNPHLHLGKLANIIKPELRHKVYCMHIDQKFSREEALNLGFNVVKAVDF
ncbi:MAG: MBL fold metallo-hydrolase [Clostridiaceae bacterium]|nr:MBL fold metallo-hydrolase [Clostridiaceae bacterium]